MTNEILFIGAAVVDFLFIILSLTFGRMGLTVAICANMILVTTFATKLVDTFGFVSNVGNIFYGSLFLAVNLLLEHYRREDVVAAIWIAFAGNILFVIMAQFALRLSGVAESVIANDAIMALFTSTSRIALASVIAYLVVQYFNMWFYSLLRVRSAGRHLWFRHISSITLSQLFDSAIFFVIAFYSVIPNSLLLEAALVGFFLKLLVGAASTPLMYVARFIRPDEDVHVAQN